MEFARCLYRAGARDFGVIKVSRGGGGNSNWVKGAYQSNPGSTPDVNGQTFENNHDGHFGWRAFWENGRVPIPVTRHSDNRGEGAINNWTGQTAHATCRDGSHRCTS